MKKLLIVFIVLLTVKGSFGQTVTAQIDSLLSSYVRLQKFNGSVLVAMKGTVLLDKGYGYRNAAGKVPNDNHSIFQIGSVTKQFTSAIILKLQQENKLNVQDHLSKYFPHYPNGDSITLQQLLTHTSGVYSYTEDRRFMMNHVSEPASREKMMALFRDKPLDFSPGTSWHYSNSGYSLLGYIIEEVTGKPYTQVVREYIFKPLKMEHSGFDFTNLSAKEKATGYFVLNDNNTVASPIVDSTVSFSAGAIYSTTEDLYRWHQALEKNTILTKEQQESAYTPVRNHYGYGWEIDSFQGKRRVSHSGGIHGFTSNFSRLPQDDVCIILLSNSSSIVLGEITNSIYAILYHQPYQLPKERKAIALSEDVLKEYIGKYEINPQLKLDISLSGTTLMAAPTGQPTVTLLPEKKDFFFVQMPDLQLEFTRNDKNQIDGFILHQGGQEVKCRKLD